MHVFGFAEPLISDNKLIPPVSYQLTQSTAKHPLSSNAYLDTRALIKADDTSITITEVTSDIEPLHSGITWLKF